MILKTLNFTHLLSSQWSLWCTRSGLSCVQCYISHTDMLSNPVSLKKPDIHPKNKSNGFHIEPDPSINQ